MDITDSTNIVGISKLFNYDGDEDLNMMERDIVGGNADAVDAVDDYRKQLDALGSSIGISLGDGDGDGDGYGGYGGGEDNDAPPVVDTIYNKLPQISSSGSYMDRMTEEEKKQKILRHVLTDASTGFSVEKEKEEDDKAIILEQIDMLMLTLSDEGINMSRVPNVDHTSSMSDISNVHKTLRLKNDRNRYCSFAEECILAWSYALEWLFDGTKTYMGHQPDLRGWSSTVNIKLRRMRYDTSTFVSSMMHDYNLSHGTRIMFELVPSLFLYSKMKKSGINAVSNDEMNSAISRLRSMEVNTTKD